MNSGRECDLHCRSGSAGDSQSLHNMQASRLERAESKYTTENYEHKPLGYLPVLWFECLRLEGNDPSRHKLLGFVTYLQHFWGVDNVWQLPSHAAFMAKRRLHSVSTSAIQSMFRTNTARTAIQADNNGRDIGTPG